MPKMKTNKSVAARFKVTATGQLKRRHAGKRHKLEKKTAARKRALGHAALVNESQLKMYKRLLGV